MQDCKYEEKILKYVDVLSHAIENPGLIKEETLKEFVKEIKQRIDSEEFKDAL